MSQQEEMPEGQNPEEELRKTEFEEDLETTDFNKKIKENIKNNMTSEGVFNVVNIFAEAVGFIGFKELGILQHNDFNSIKSLLKYEQYLRKAFEEQCEGKNQEEELDKIIEFIVSHSNQEIVDKINLIIENFNGDLDEIKEKQDTERITKDSEDVKGLILGEAANPGFANATEEDVRVFNKRTEIDNFKIPSC